MTGLLLKVSDGIMRGPELAKIDLVMRLRDLGVEVCPFASPNLLILDYVQKFGHKMCCYDDLTVVLGERSKCVPRFLLSFLYLRQP